MSIFFFDMEDIVHIACVDQGSALMIHFYERWSGDLDMSDMAVMQYHNMAMHAHTLVFKLQRKTCLNGKNYNSCGEVAAAPVHLWLQMKSSEFFADIVRQLV